MAGWAGFSDEELRRLQLKDQAVSASVVGRGRRPTPSNRSRQQLQREEALQMAAKQKSGLSTLPPEQKLAMPPPQGQKLAMSPPQPVKQLVATVKQVEAPVAAPREKVETVDFNHDPVPAETTPIAKELEKQEAELREKTRMEILQEDQKLIEEKNKRKKALLTKTIAEKSKQTQAEAVKLKRIQKELQALDDMVSNDIGILRARIEEASWDYNSARKRYEKAETEYVTAKLDLHKKTEVKEQLTEHLYAIIQQNELRKASKLEELMQQLQLQTTEEEEPKKEQQKKTKEGVNGNTVEEKLQEAGPVVEQSVQDQGSVAGTQIKAEGDDTEGRKDCPPVSEPKTRDLDCKNADGAPKGQTETPASAS